MSRRRNTHPSFDPLDTMTRQLLFRRLRGLGLPQGDFLVAGSAPLLLHGFRHRIADLDVLARGPAWTMAQRLGSVEAAPYQGRSTVKVAGGSIEILNGWFPDWLVEDDLFDRADRVGGLCVMSLEDTRRWKERLGRNKDLADLRQLGAGRRRLAVGADHAPMCATCVARAVA
ncbi:hypothetical protein [Solihabitans fulvus]|uniref:hypothetical protein n=1 Tax=Solihabitans fulvus TaxID=1892852 RepID=UPI001661D4D9|nr:hypothetical protein [Solihabitans fulvus]